jgi:hypothetical protein
VKIAFLTEHFLPKIDGVVTRLCHTLNALNELGDETLVITGGDGIKSFNATPIHRLRSFSFPLYPEKKSYYL